MDTVAVIILIAILVASLRVCAATIEVWIEHKQKRAELIYKEVDWDEFERTVQKHLEAADNPWVPIDIDKFVKRGERDMKLVTRKEKMALDAQEAVIQDHNYKVWRQLYNEGWTMSRIASVHGVSVNAVNKGLLHTAPPEPTPYEYYYQGHTIQEVARTYGTSAAAEVSEILARQHEEGPESFQVDQLEGTISEEPVKRPVVSIEEWWIKDANGLPTGGELRPDYTLGVIATADCQCRDWELHIVKDQTGPHRITNCVARHRFVHPSSRVNFEIAGRDINRGRNGTFVIKVYARNENGWSM